jgi:large subunit ribosomal protein L13
MKLYKTYNVTPKDVEKKWYIIDAAGQRLGRVAERAAYYIRGKHKPTYTPYLDTGDNVIIINAAQAVVSGQKMSDKMYHHHTGFPGGIRSFSYEKLVERDPVRPMEIAVKGMLPNGALGHQLFGNLRVYKDADHPHTAQNPEPLQAK